MHFRMQAAIIAFVVSTIVLSPTLISSQPAHAVTKCEDEKGKSSQWISGCKDGWYNWDKCGNGPSGTPKTDYDKGWVAGWNKGKEANPKRTGC
jgi:hypothetical protein